MSACFNVSTKHITVVFSSLEGFQRRPIDFTCGNVMELHVSYESFVDLRQEFNEILDSGVWVTDVI